MIEEVSGNGYYRRWYIALFPVLFVILCIWRILVGDNANSLFDVWQELAETTIASTAIFIALSEGIATIVKWLRGSL